MPKLSVILSGPQTCGNVQQLRADRLQRECMCLRCLMRRKQLIVGCLQACGRCGLAPSNSASGRRNWQSQGSERHAVGAGLAHDGPHPQGAVKSI